MVGKQTKIHFPSSKPKPKKKENTFTLKYLEYIKRLRRLSYELKFKKNQHYEKTEQ